MLKDLGLEIRIEPGRSLLTQTGMTIAKVAHRKQHAKGKWLVGLEMNMSQMISFSEDFLLDPYVMYADNADSNAPVDVFFTGPIVWKEMCCSSEKFPWPNSLL
ncbi:hypothetical protein GCM10027284_33130 [Cyclobacterium sediminis]